MKFSDTAKHFFTFQFLAPSVVGALLLSLLGEVLSQGLFVTLGTTLPALAGIACGAVLAFAFIVWVVKRSWEGASRPLQLRLRPTRPNKRKGLVVLISHQEPAAKAIEHHLPTLRKCWLICSSRTLDCARLVRDRYGDECQFSEPIIINDVHNPLEFYDRIKEIFANLPLNLKGQDVVVDYTGMTAHGSVAVALACIHLRFPIQYTPALYGPDLRANGSGEPIEVVLDWSRLGIRKPRQRTKAVSAA